MEFNFNINKISNQSLLLQEVYKKTQHPLHQKGRHATNTKHGVLNNSKTTMKKTVC